MPSAKGTERLRLFTALWPAPTTRSSLAACRDRIAWPAASRPVATPKLHLTLHFIGAVTPAQARALADALQPPQRRFELHFGELQLWHGGLVVLMPAAAPPPLLELHRSQAATLRALGLPVEGRAFRPHVTLGRDGPRRLGEVAPRIDLRWPVRSHALVCSRPDGRYEVLRRYVAA